MKDVDETQARGREGWLAPAVALESSSCFPNEDSGGKPPFPAASLRDKAITGSRMANSELSI